MKAEKVTQPEARRNFSQILHHHTPISLYDPKVNEEVTAEEWKMRYERERAKNERLTRKLRGLSGGVMLNGADGESWATEAWNSAAATPRESTSSTPDDRVGGLAPPPPSSSSQGGAGRVGGRRAVSMVNLSGGGAKMGAKLRGADGAATASMASLASTPSPSQETLLTKENDDDDDDEVRRRLFTCVNCKELENDNLGG